MEAGSNSWMACKENECEGGRMTLHAREKGWMENL